MAIKEYIHTGECIWCKRKKPYVTFFTAPHIVPKSLGGTEIGFDICDDCNKYFGKCTSENKTISIDLAFKEVFNACINSLGDRAEKLMPYSSALFHYNRAQDKIKLKRSFSLSHFTYQFKRALYEVFLQKYHQTFPDDNLDRFEFVRKFARYGWDNPTVFFAINKMIFHFDSTKDDIMLSMSEPQIDFMNRTGFYHFMFCGKHLFLEVLPITAHSAWPKSYQEMFSSSVVPCDSECRLEKLTNIWDFDMFYTTLAPKLLYRNGKYLY